MPWAADEKQAPVPGWGMWLVDVGYHQDQVGIGDATDPNATPAVTPPSTSPTVSTSLFLVAGAVTAGAILGYMLCKGA